jgi:predicted hydrocarbon binding protein
MNRGGEKNREENERVSTAFIIMPADALVTLREELTPLASEPAVKAILFRYGFRSGESFVSSMGIKVSSKKKLTEALSGLWDEIGLGRLSIKKSKKEEFKFILNESVEAEVMGDVGTASCDFTRGYLAGMVSYLSGKRYHSKEDKCASKGDNHCIFLLTEKREVGGG